MQDSNNNNQHQETSNKSNIGNNTELFNQLSVLFCTKYHSSKLILNDEN